MNKIKRREIRGPCWRALQRPSALPASSSSRPFLHRDRFLGHCSKLWEKKERKKKEVRTKKVKKEKKEEKSLPSDGAVVEVGVVADEAGAESSFDAAGLGERWRLLEDDEVSSSVVTLARAAAARREDRADWGAVTPSSSVAVVVIVTSGASGGRSLLRDLLEALSCFSSCSFTSISLCNVISMVDWEDDAVIKITVWGSEEANSSFSWPFNTVFTEGE